MKRPTPGRYVKVAAAGEAFRVFIPAPLPPKPPIHWAPKLRARFDAALLALGRLEAVTALPPNAGHLRTCQRRGRDFQYPGLRCPCATATMRIRRDSTR